MSARTQSGRAVVESAAAGAVAGAVVQTVLGPLDVHRLGRVLMHEHVFVVDVEMTQNYPALWGHDDAHVDTAVATLDEAAASGIDTIVDLTVIGLGRNVARVQRVAERTAMQIIVATGIYTYDEVPRTFRLRGPGLMLGGHDRMVEMFVRDIREGIGETGIRAAILKCATDKQGLTPGVERVLRAVAQAHRQTGVPITTHTDADLRTGLDQQRVFAEEGVRLERVIVGHCGDTTDLDYLVELMQNGSYIGMDRFGIDYRLPLEQRVATVARLCEMGWAHRLVLSQDFGCYLDVMNEQERQRTNPNWSYVNVTRQVIPELIRRGVTSDQIDAMLVHNPISIFSAQDRY
jgi:phosphotriesterase-related protein